jgi:CubicO group peptidase (beta-lactamase class C family)
MLKSFFNLSALLLFLLVTRSVCHAQTSLPDDVKDNIKARIDNDLTPGIVVGILDANGVKYYSFGVKSLITKSPVNEHSVFEIGSITKSFTGIILADMVTKGEVKLDDPLQQHVPKAVTVPTRNGSVIKLLNLANHTSSLPRLPGNFAPANPNNPYADYSEKHLYDFLSSYTLLRDIGSDYEYSNYGMGLLGHVLAAKRGVSYEQLMINTIAKPLDLKNTRITLTPEMKENLALGYAGGALAENWDLTSLAGAGAIRSTAEDMMRYVQANMGLVKSNLYPAMQLAHKNSREAEAKPMVGLGWHIMTANDQEIIWHNGGTGGYRSFIGFIKGTNKAVVVLSNSIVSVDDIGAHLLNPTAPLTVFKPYELAKPIPVEAAVLEKYVGQYVLMPGLIITVTRTDQQLKVQLTGQPAFPVFAKSETEFFYKVVDAQLTFTLNKEGTATESVTLRQNGQNLVGTKQVK